MKGEKILISAMILNVFFGCRLPVDLGGAFYSYSTPDGRFDERDNLPYPSDPTSLNNPPVGGSGYSYTFAVMSDIHVDGDSAAVLTDMVQNRLLPSDMFFLNCGDSTQNGGEEQLQTYRTVMDASGKPWFSTIGNHDLFYSGWKPYRAYIGRTSYALEVGTAGAPGSMLIIALDSANGTLGGKQLRWVEKKLSGEKGLWDHTVVFTHCQFFSSGVDTIVQFTDTEEIYRLVHLFTECSVDYVFMGHNHQWDKRKINGVTYVALDALKEGEPDKSFVRITVNGEDLSLARMIISGN